MTARPKPAAIVAPRRPVWRRAVKVLKWALVTVVVVLAVFRLMAAARETGDASALAPKGGQFIETGDARIFVHDEGPRGGAPVLLIHGTAAWSEFWRGTIEHLKAQSFRVIAIDLPPFGFSDRPDDASYTRADQARRIAAVIEHLKLEKVTLVGHSFGAGATVETVMRTPERIAGLVLVAPALSLPVDGVAAAKPSAAVTAFLNLPVIPEAVVSATGTNPMLTRWLLSTMLARTEMATPALADILRLPMARRGTTAEFVRWAHYFVTPDTKALSLDPKRYAALGVPTRLIWGNRDSITPLAQGQRLERLIPGATLNRLPGLGHIPQIEDPDAFRPLLVKLIGEVRARP